MSYVKLPKTTQDHFVGYQSVNQAIDNNAALLSLYDAKHAQGVGGFNAQMRPLNAIGRHDDILIARSVGEFDVDTTLATPSLKPRMLGPLFGSLQYDRLAAGQWRIYLASPQLVGAVALMKSSASVDEKATCYTVYDTSRGPSVIVTTWLRDSGAWAPADLPFSLIVWAQTA